MLLIKCLCSVSSSLTFMLPKCGKKANNNKNQIEKLILAKFYKAAVLRYCTDLPHLTWISIYTISKVVQLQFWWHFAILTHAFKSMQRISGLSGLWFSLAAPVCSGTGHCKMCRCHKQKLKRCFSSFSSWKSSDYYWWKDSHTICFQTLNVLARTCMRQAAAGICLLKCFCRCFCWTLRAKPEPRIPWKKEKK